MGWKELERKTNLEDTRQRMFVNVDMRAYKAGWFEPAPHLHGYKEIIRAGLSARAT